MDKLAKSKPVKKLDKSKPYSEIIGQPGLAYLQDGVTFNGTGTPVTPAAFAALQDVNYVEPEPVEDPEDLPRYYVQDEKHAAEPPAEGLDDMSWHKLKSMLEIYGEVYTTKEEALKFLKGR